MRRSVRLVGPTHPFKGGIAQHTTELAFRLAEAGQDVCIESWSRQYPARLYPGQQRVLEPDGRRFPDVHYDLSWRNPASWVRVGRRLAASADVVVIVLASPVQVPIYLVMLLALRRGGRRGRRPAVLVVAHNVVPHEARPGDELLVRRLLRLVDGVLVHSARDLAAARKLGAKNVSRARLPAHLPGGGASEQDPELEQGQELEQVADVGPASQVALVFFGLVRPYKGLDVLFRAMAQAPARLHLTVAGEFWEPVEAYRQLANELGIADRVTLRAGYVRGDEVAAVLAAADALVLPYRSATGSQNVDLAFAHGLPVVATDVGALAESVGDGRNGFVVPPDDVPALAQALTQLCEPGRLAALRRGVEQTVPRDDWPAYLSELVGLAVELPGGRGPSGRVAAGTQGITEEGSARVGDGRQVQLAYSEIETRMLDEQKRRRKAAKILAVLRHFLGRDDLSGLVVLDLGTSAGFIASELSRAGGKVIGVDIDEPGLMKAKANFGHEVTFLAGSGDQLPIGTGRVDVVIFNHIYEHVLDPDAVLAEIRRVLRPTGVVYLGVANRLGVIEPHYNLPFLSWLTPSLSDRYVRLSGKGDAYHERFRTWRGLLRMTSGLSIWDYSAAVLADPSRFHARDMLPSQVKRVPPQVTRSLRMLLPTYIWVGTPSRQGPAGDPLAVGPVAVAEAGSDA